jgi:hypothetical protein
LGLLMGPLVLSLGVSALRIYEMDVLRPPPAAATAPRETAGAVVEARAAAEASKQAGRNAGTTDRAPGGSEHR